MKKNRSYSINPADENVVAEFKRLTIAEAEAKLADVGAAYQRWKQKSLPERSALMENLAMEFENNKSYYAHLITLEMGKTIAQAVKEVEKCALICRYYADNTEALLAPAAVETEAHSSYVTFQPIGVILAVMPWNYPIYQVIRFAAPALMAGNTGVLKHASNVQGCAFAIENAFIRAGFPENTFINLNVEAADVEKIIENRHVVAVTLTGSEAAGRSVASIAGKNLKKTVLELGGSDPYIILDDADVEFAAKLATAARMQNCGQTCIAGKRFIVLKDIYEKFTEVFTVQMRSLKMGDPLDALTDYGPMSRVDLRNELHRQVQKTVEEGGRLVLGGFIPDQVGAFYPATIIADVKPGMEAFDNELFGPVAAVIKADTIQDAVELANLSVYGLGAGVISGDRNKGEEVALQLDAGSCFVNKMVISDPRLPFGGIKNSGYGRELSGYGIREFVNIKTIWVE